MEQNNSVTTQNTAVTTSGGVIVQSCVQGDEGSILGGVGGNISDSTSFSTSQHSTPQHQKSTKPTSSSSASPGLSPPGKIFGRNNNGTSEY